MKLRAYPSISVISVSYNTPIWLWEKTLHALYSQDYPKNKIEHIVVDAGSTNGTLEILKKYPIKILSPKGLAQKPLTRMGMAIQKAQNDIILFLEPDNIMIGNTWLKQMVRPFVENSDIVGTFSAYNGFERQMPMFTRYCALFGINDPVVLYLKKSEKLPLYQKTYPLNSLVSEEDGYSILRFDKHSLPTLGDNGHMVRRKDINKVFQKPQDFVHTDAFVSLLVKGKNTYAAVRNSIIHYTGPSMFRYLVRRIEYKSRDFDQNKKKRLYLVFDGSSSKDRRNIFLFIVYALIFVQPLSLSFRGFFVLPDLAWFLHPVVCFFTVFAYGISEIRLFVQKKKI
jgi:glycosyltransferase involved in cell wall biosynthesis